MREGGLGLSGASNRASSVAIGASRLSQAGYSSCQASNSDPVALVTCRMSLCAVLGSTETHEHGTAPRTHARSSLVAGDTRGGRRRVYPHRKLTGNDTIVSKRDCSRQNGEALGESRQRPTRCRRQKLGANQLAWPAAVTSRLPSPLPKSQGLQTAGAGMYHNIAYSMR